MDNCPFCLKKDVVICDICAQKVLAIYNSGRLNEAIEMAQGYPDKLKIFMQFKEEEDGGIRPGRRFIGGTSIGILGDNKIGSRLDKIKRETSIYKSKRQE
ncbi:MAG: hypothetical protein KJ556_21510 [Gammaproteobacteria bacterium]|nr:hypothetical protein [Gammaproteobacteria bacterium]